MICVEKRGCFGRLTTKYVGRLRPWRNVCFWKLRKWHICSFAVFLNFIFGVASSPCAQIQDEVRAAFVFNLTKYIEWPRPDAEFRVGYVGHGPMGSVLQETLTGKFAGSRPIRVLLDPSSDEIIRCKIIYVDNLSSHEWREVLRLTGQASILTVSDSSSFADHGGMIGLVLNGDRVQLQINLETTQAAGLKVSSRLLSVSVVVHSKREGRR